MIGLKKSASKASKGTQPDVKSRMEALDVLEERLDRISDQLNLLWDKVVVGIEEEEVR